MMMFIHILNDEEIKIDTFWELRLSFASSQMMTTTPYTLKQQQSERKFIMVMVKMSLKELLVCDASLRKVDSA